MLFLLSAQDSRKSVPPPEYRSVEKHIKNKNLDAQFKSLGGHKGDCMAIHLTNKTRSKLAILVQAGRRLVSKDTSITF